MGIKNRAKTCFRKQASCFCLAVLVVMLAQTSLNGQQCNLSALPSIEFRPNSTKILKTAESLLISVAKQMRENPACNLKVIGYGVACKRCQQLSWDHVNTVIGFLIEKEGISGDRLIFLYAEEGESPTIVDLVPTTEAGPTSVPAPFPNLRRNR